jgi:hypothetical protein
MFVTLRKTVPQSWSIPFGREVRGESGVDAATGNRRRVSALPQVMAYARSPHLATRDRSRGDDVDH